MKRVITRTREFVVKGEKEKKGEFKVANEKVETRLKQGMNNSFRAYTFKCLSSSCRLDLCARVCYE